MFYITNNWKDENVNKVCANQMTIQEFFEKCDPNMEKEDRQELFYHYFHTYFHDHKFRIDPEWLSNQWDREDHEDRLTAFYESIHDAIVTDDECWYNKGRDVFLALMSNNATALLIALCGWGPETLARRVLMKRGVAQYSDEVVKAKIMVEWDDGNRYSTACRICAEQHLVFDFNHDIFTREDNPTTKITKIFVRFSPFDSGYEYDFQCVSKDERDQTNDDEIFWYDPNEEDEADEE